MCLNLKPDAKESLHSVGIDKFGFSCCSCEVAHFIVPPLKKRHHALLVPFCCVVIFDDGFIIITVK